MSGLAGLCRMPTLAGVEVLVLSLIITAFGVWWLFKEEEKESEERYNNSREFNHERYRAPDQRPNGDCWRSKAP
jgi:hypothetical protein